MLSIPKILPFFLLFSLPPQLATSTRNLRMLLISWWICPLPLGKTSHSSLPFCSPKPPLLYVCTHELCKAEVDLAAVPSWPPPAPSLCFPVSLHSGNSCGFSRGPPRMLSSSTVTLESIPERKERQTAALEVPIELCHVLLLSA